MLRLHCKGSLPQFSASVKLQYAAKRRPFLMTSLVTAEYDQMGASIGMSNGTFTDLKLEAKVTATMSGSWLTEISSPRTSS